MILELVLSQRSRDKERQFPNICNEYKKTFVADYRYKRLLLIFRDLISRHLEWFTPYLDSFNARTACSIVIPNATLFSFSHELIGCIERTYINTAVVYVESYDQRDYQLINESKYRMLVKFCDISAPTELVS
ncbi:hypothetical protein EfmAA818_18100 [Enterococcus faecium]|nr:hypothetical protein EfmAA818_18100 [Enterococcus faecium]